MKKTVIGARMTDSMIDQITEIRNELNQFSTITATVLYLINLGIQKHYAINKK